jgi:repressor LexA
MANYDKSSDIDPKLTPRQEVALIEILKFDRNRGKPPTIRELARAMGKAHSNIHGVVVKLKDKGYVEPEEVGSRAEPRDIVLTVRAIEWLRSSGMDVSRYTQPMIRDFVRAVPVLGEVAAGNPRDADGNIREYLTLPAQYLPIGDVFVLDVKGDSMIGDGVLDGDQVIVVQYPEPRGNGEMVAALVGDSATIKRLWRDKEFYRLEPSNPDFEATIIYPEDRAAIQGRVVGVLRWKVT